MSFGIYISTIVLIYIFGIFVALKVYDRTSTFGAGTDLPESQKAAARARAGIFWPARVPRVLGEGKTISLVSGTAAIPDQQRMDTSADINL